MMLAQRSTACAGALLLACANVLVASDTTVVSQGARVRVKFEQEKAVAHQSGAISYETESIRLVGEATVLKPDTLVVLPEESETPLAIPYSTIHEIEVAQGKKSNWLKGGLYGGIAGTVLGFLPALAVAATCEGACDFSPAAAWVATAVGGFAVGAGIGALSSSDRWVKAAMPAPPPVALGVGKDGSVRLAFSLRL